MSLIGLYDVRRQNMFFPVSSGEIILPPAWCLLRVKEAIHMPPQAFAVKCMKRSLAWW